MKALQGIYKANQCTDINDCNYAISEVKMLIRNIEKTDGSIPADKLPTKALYKRLISLENKAKKFQA